jgi:hypothetical protein
MQLAAYWKQSVAAKIVVTHTKIVVTHSANGASVVEAGTVMHVPTQPIPPRILLIQLAAETHLRQQSRTATMNQEVSKRPL